MSFPLLRLLIGRPVGSTDTENQKIGALAGLPAMGLDGLSSAAYAPEAALGVLAVSGAAGLAAIGPITWFIVILLGVLSSSYWQTIAAYPNNGGSYIVSSDNLGTNAGLLAASALMADYLLNVAVGISAGVGALTSAIPTLHPYTLSLCLGVLCVVTLINLRGTRESGLAWATPTYLFIGCLGVVVCWGAYNAITSDWKPHPSVALPAIPRATEPLSLWLAFHAFASGCTAMTGVETVSNGVSAFREPRIQHARATLAAIVSILTILLLGVAYVSEAYGVVPMDQSKTGYQSVLSQLVGAVFGRNWLYYLTMGSVLAVLCLSANTSFVGFPRLCHLLAENGFLPRPFAVPGRRLVYSVGILFLSAGAAVLLIAFEGVTTRLIPLFAVGAFLAFTLSQVGMATHWLRALRHPNPKQRPGAPASPPHKAFSSLLKLLVNGAGGIATGLALAVILASKFTEGAWLIVIVIPCAIVALRSVRRYYDEVDRQLLRGGDRHINLRSHAPPIVLVPLSRWDRLSRRALEYALRISPEVTALHVINLEGQEAEEKQAILRKEWEAFVNEPALRAGMKPPRLELISSEYRSIGAPLLRLIQAAQEHWPERPITIVLPELIEGHWWGYLMHANRERQLRKRLLRCGGPAVVISSVPWQLIETGPAEALADEEEQIGA